jgi:hypothetical protein
VDTGLDSCGRSIQAYTNLLRSHSTPLYYMKSYSNTHNTTLDFLLWPIGMDPSSKNMHSSIQVIRVCIYAPEKECRLRRRMSTPTSLARCIQEGMSASTSHSWVCSYTAVRRVVRSCKLQPGVTPPFLPHFSPPPSLTPSHTFPRPRPLSNDERKQAGDPALGADVNARHRDGGTLPSWLVPGKARLTILYRPHPTGRGGVSLIQAAVECEHIHILQ